MDKLVTIAIAPHLKKFIYTFHNIKEGQPVRVDMSSSIGMSFNYCMGKPIVPSVGNTYNRTAEITLEMSNYFQSLRYKSYISPNFSAQYARIFKEYMRQWIVAQYHAGITESQAIRSFLKFYNITEDEYSYSSAQRQWSRFKNGEYFKVKKRSIL